MCEKRFIVTNEAQRRAHARAEARRGKVVRAIKRQITVKLGVRSGPSRPLRRSDA